MTRHLANLFDETSSRNPTVVCRCLVIFKFHDLKSTFADVFVIDTFSNREIKPQIQRKSPNFTFVTYLFQNFSSRELYQLSSEKLHGYSYVNQYDF